MREVVIRTGSVAIRARILRSPAGDALWAALPIYGSARAASGALSIRLPTPLPLAVAADEPPDAGDIAYDPSTRCLVIALTRIPAAGACRLLARTIDEASPLAEVPDHAAIALLMADS